MLIEAGCTTLGESRPQQLWDKAERLADCANVEWHLIGHLQRNKLARTLPLVSMIQSIDSVRLLKAVNELSAKRHTKSAVLLEVNISADEGKHGFSPTVMPEIVRHFSEYENVTLHGLMAMARRNGGKDQARHDFIALRKLRDSMLEECPDNASLVDLSMGMSSDFEIAIEEGATIVRVGSALFQE